MTRPVGAAARGAALVIGAGEPEEPVEARPPVEVEEPLDRGDEDVEAAGVDGSAADSSLVVEGDGVGEGVVERVSARPLRLDFLVVVPEVSEVWPAADGPLAVWLPRPERRVGVLASADEPAETGLEEPEEPEPVDPAEPVVSANAIGIAARPEPTPRATASAPTQPTYSE